ncbi:MAG TPA: alpha/beta hydrolase [Abditibacterium sp.]|jgi:pimeloyl-ACP methyl ester carboxylesterase
MEISLQTGAANGMNLQVAHAGPAEGPLVILLHGFPDFWWGWRHQIEALAARGFRVIAPDMRGYNLSDKPEGVGAYQLETLAADVVALADLCGADRFRLAGHDWGGIVAWHVAAHHPQRVEKLAILNAPHPDVFLRYARRHLSQMLRSNYVGWFQLPRVPEAILKARHFAFLRRALRSSSRPGTFSDADLERYCQAWAPPGALTAMINYYRALARRPWRRLRCIEPPTLLIWGLQDAFLEPGVARASLKQCQQRQSVLLEEAGHWVQLEEAAAVNEALLRFFNSA